jgi:flagellar assembly factor FliW
MKVDTYLFGAVEVSPEKVITFPTAWLPSRITSVSCWLTKATKRRASDQFHPAVAGRCRTWLSRSSIRRSLGFNYELALTDAENALLQTPAPEDVAVMQVLFKKEERRQGLEVSAEPARTAGHQYQGPHRPAESHGNDAARTSRCPIWRARFKPFRSS